MRGRRQQGFALILVLVVFSLLLGALALLVSQQLVDAQYLRRELFDLHLQAIADSGIALALARLKAEPTTRGEFDEALDGGSVDFEIRTFDEKHVEVDLEARYQGARRFFQVTIELKEAGPRLVDWRPSRAKS